MRRGSEEGAGGSPEESQLPAEVQAASVLPLSPPLPTTTTTSEGEAGSAQVCNYETQAASSDEAAQLQLLLLLPPPTTSTLAHATDQMAASQHLKTKVRVPRSFAFKQNVIECYTQCRSNTSITNPAAIVADMYNVHYTSVIRWYRDRLKIKPKAKAKRTRNATRGDADGQHKTLYKDCDKKLVKEFKEKRQKGNRIGPKWLKMRMRQLLLEFDSAALEKFKGNGPWLHRWTRRNGIRVRKSTNRKSTCLLDRMPKIETW